MIRRDFVFVLAALPAIARADVRVRVRVGAGHPIRRSRTVVVRRPPAVMRTRVTYLPVVRFRRAVVVLPPPARHAWTDSETIHRREDWVDTNFRVNKRGTELFLDVRGRVEVDFAEVEFDNGETQVVDFNEERLESGVYPLLDFRNGREVDAVRIVARARTQEARVGVVLAR
jgi:hypothetical protein